MPEGIDVPEPSVDMGTTAAQPTIIDANMPGPGEDVMEVTSFQAPDEPVAIETPGGSGDIAGGGGTKPGDNPEIPNQTDTPPSNDDTLGADAPALAEGSATDVANTDANDPTNQQVQPSKTSAEVVKTDAPEATDAANAIDNRLPDYSTVDGVNDATGTNSADGSEDAQGNKQQGPMRQLASSVSGYLKNHARELSALIAQTGMAYTEYERQKNEAERTKVTGELAKSAAAAAGISRL